MALTGKLIHVGVDLLLVSTLLAGIRRNTGLQFDLNRWNPPKNKQYEKDWHPTAQKYVGRYLGWGESFYDYMVATLGSSKYFERK
ncbi:hypothetical protein MOSE0_G00914 [Monosporozyma servazzii]